MKTITIFYQTNPMDTIAGGIDTFIKGILKDAPKNFEFQVVGITTDIEKYSVGKWHDCITANGKNYKFFPVLFEGNASKQAKIPLSLRYTFQLFKYRKQITGDMFDKRPKTLFVHQDLQALKSTKSDIRWGSFTSIFYLIEKQCMKAFDVIHCVKESAAEYYKKELPKNSDNIFFTPTWYDPDLFKVEADETRKVIRSEVRAEFGGDKNCKFLIFVGRLDYQKDPLFLVEAMKEIQSGSNINFQLLLIGDGILKKELLNSISNHNLDNQVHLLGVIDRSRIAYLMQGCDAFVLSSNYEGMPIAVLEAVATGLPIISTDVGEIKRIVNSNNGIISDKNVISYAENIEKTINKFEGQSAAKIANTVSQYRPYDTLKNIYKRYADL
jgi:glycosyltransferase involved in cell wall biosynthesis